MEYVYLIQEREFIKTAEDIYKVGMTKQPSLARFKSYPNGSTLLFHIACDNCRSTESAILAIFRKKFIPRIDIGYEYFEGNYKAMIAEIFTLVVGQYRLELSEKSLVINSFELPEKSRVINSFERTTAGILKNLVMNHLIIIGIDHKRDVMFGGKEELVNWNLLSTPTVDYDDWEFNIRDNNLWIDCEVPILCMEGVINI